MPIRLYLLTITDNSVVCEPFRAETAIIAGKHYHLVEANAAATTENVLASWTTPPKQQAERAAPKPAKPPRPPYTGPNPDFAPVRDTMLDLLLDAGEEGFPAIALYKAISKRLPGVQFMLGPIVSALARTGQIRRIGEGLTARWAIK